jgi:hypothetical protein
MHVLVVAHGVGDDALIGSGLGVLALLREMQARADQKRLLALVVLAIGPESVDDVALRDTGDPGLRIPLSGVLDFLRQLLRIASVSRLVTPNVDALGVLDFDLVDELESTDRAALGDVREHAGQPLDDVLAGSAHQAASELAAGLEAARTAMT